MYNNDQIEVNNWVENLISEDPRMKIKAAKDIKKIAEILGPSRTRNELLKYFNEFYDDNDEVIQTLINELDGFWEYMGGAQYIAKIMPHFEKICYVDDKESRKKCIEILKKISGDSYDFNNKDPQFLSLIKKLSIDNFYTSKCSAVSLICRIFLNRLSDTSKAELMSILISQSNTKVPMVKKTIALEFGTLLQGLPRNEYHKEVIDLITKLVTDPHDNVRMSSIYCIIKIPQFYDFSDRVRFYDKIFVDASWRVKYKVCQNIRNILGHITKENMDFIFRENSLMDNYQSYMMDAEIELRILSTKNLKKIVKWIMDQEKGKEYLTPDYAKENVMPLLNQIVEDSNLDLRIALAKSVQCLARVFVTKNECREYLMPIFVKMLDTDSPSQIKVELLRHLADLADKMPKIELIEHVEKALKELKKDENWRIRASVIEILVYLIKIEDNFLEQSFLTDMMQHFLEDKVFRVREKMIASIKTFGEIIGKKWIQESALPSQLEFINDKDYTKRQNFTLAVVKIKTVIPEIMNKEVEKGIDKCLHDEMANVRMSAIWPFKQFASYETLQKELERILKTDKDNDMRLQAQKQYKEMFEKDI